MARGLDSRRGFLKDRVALNSTHRFDSRLLELETVESGEELVEDLAAMPGHRAKQQRIRDGLARQQRRQPHKQPQLDLTPNLVVVVDEQASWE